MPVSVRSRTNGAAKAAPPPPPPATVTEETVTETVERASDVVARNRFGEGGKVQVSRTYKVSGEASETNSEELLEITPFVTDTAKVSVNVKMTKNLGNYESLQVGVMVTLPAYIEEIDAAYAQASAKAGEYLQAELAAVNGTPEESTRDPLVMENNAESAITEAAEQEAVADETEAAAEEAGGEESGEEAITAEQVLAMDRDELEQLITDNGLEIDPAQYKKTAAGTKELAEAVVALAFSEEGEEAVETGEGEEADPIPDEGIDREAEAEADAEEPYTEAQLNAASEDELKEIFKVWELGDYPAGPPKVRRAKAVKAILVAQEG